MTQDRASSRGRLRGTPRAGCVARAVATVVMAVLCGAACIAMSYGRNQDLMEASSSGSVAWVRFWLVIGRDPNSRQGAMGWTPLGEALAHGHAKAARILLDAGADPNALHGDYPPLLVASAVGPSATVLDLLADGAEIEARGPDGTTAVHMACRSSDGAAVLGALVGNGAGVDLADSEGRVPLHEAADWGAYDCARALLAAGANPGVPDHSGHTPADVAAGNGYHYLAALLREAEAGRLPPAPAGESGPAGAQSR